MPLPIFQLLQAENRKLRKLNAEMLAILKRALPLVESQFKPENSVLQELQIIIAKAEKDES